MLENEAARMTDIRADHCAALSRLGLLIETVTSSVARISTAPSVIEALPDVLATLARVVHIDRVVMVETLSRGEGLPSQSLLSNWTAPDGAAAPLCAEALIRAAARGIAGMDAAARARPACGHDARQRESGRTAIP